MKKTTKILISFYLFLLTIVFIFLVQSCGIVKWTAGADIDSATFAKSREAKMLDLRYISARVLSERLMKGEPYDNADLNIYLSPDFLKKILNQYKNSKGWLDEYTSYTIDSLFLKLYFGSANITAFLTANNTKYDVDVNLAMDCILAVDLINNELYIRLEPYNITPMVSAKGLISGLEEIIQNLIKINLSNLGSQFPDLKIPMKFDNNMIMSPTKTIIKDKVNMIINNPERSINYNLILKEFLIFDNTAFISMNINKIEIIK